MPTITCTHCGASIFALTVGESLDVKGGDDLRRCEALVDNADDDVSIDLVLECDYMERAIEETLQALSATDSPVNLTWPVDRGGKRAFERWGPLAGVLAVGNRHHPCAVLEISPGGATVWGESTTEIPEGASVSFEPDGYQTLEGEVTRRSGRTLGLRFLLSAEQRNDIAEWLMQLRQSVQARRRDGRR